MRDDAAYQLVRGALAKVLIHPTDIITFLRQMSRGEYDTFYLSNAYWGTYTKKPKKLFSKLAGKLTTGNVLLCASNKCGNIDFRGNETRQLCKRGRLFKPLDMEQEHGPAEQYCEFRNIVAFRRR